MFSLFQNQDYDHSFKISIESSESNLVNFIKVSFVKRSEAGSIKFVKVPFVKRSESGSVDLIKVSLLIRPFCKGTESCPVQLIEISFSEGVTAKSKPEGSFKVSIIVKYTSESHSLFAWPANIQ